MTDLHKIEITELNENDCERVIHLINSVQPHIPWDKEHFHWQYFGRAGYQAKLFGATHEQQLVGFYAAVRNKFLFNSFVRDVFIVQDVMTSESFRGQGILHLLGGRCASVIDEIGSIGLTFPNEKSANSFRRLGWTEVMGVPLREAGCVKSDIGSALQFSQVAAFGNSVEEIWNESGLRIGIQRDAEYLNWRYSKPATQYLKFIVGKDVGYLVLKLYTGDKVPKLHLLDLVLKEKELESTGEVLNFVFSIANDLGASLVTCWLPSGHMYEDYFSNSGFLTINSHNRSIFVRDHYDGDIPSAGGGKWHFSQGDSDVF